MLAAVHAGPKQLQPGIEFDWLYRYPTHLGTIDQLKMSWNKLIKWIRFVTQIIGLHVIVPGAVQFNIQLGGRNNIEFIIQ